MSPVSFEKKFRKPAGIIDKFLRPEFIQDRKSAVFPREPDFIPERHMTDYADGIVKTVIFVFIICMLI